MKKLIVLAACLMAVAMIGSGCTSTGIVHKEYVNGEMVKKVSIYRGSLATVTDASGLKIDYQGVTAELDSYSNKGDADLIREISAGVVGGIIAYSTGGASSVQSGVAAALKALKAKTAPASNPASGSNASPACSDGSCSLPVTP